MIPVRQLDAQFLFQEAQNLISTLQNAGGVVVAVLRDGKRVNQLFFKLFDTKSNTPLRTNDVIFLLFDYVHLLNLFETAGLRKKLGSCFIPNPANNV